MFSLCESVCVCVCVCVFVSSWRNVVLKTPIAVGTNTNWFQLLCRMSVCLSVCQHDGDSAVRELYRCVAEIKMKAELQDGYGATHEH